MDDYNGMHTKIKIICNILTRFFKKPIELDLIRLSYPYFNANILVNFLGMFINKIQLRRIVKTLSNKFLNEINTSVEKVDSKMTYKSQWVLEEIIKELEKSV